MGGTSRTVREDEEGERGCGLNSGRSRLSAAVATGEAAVKPEPEARSHEAPRGNRLETSPHVRHEAGI